jgi:hypothetical protein
MPIAAQLHLWPWSCASAGESVDLSSGTACIPFYGSPVLSLVEHAYIFLPSRHERFISLGPAFPYLPEGLSCRLYETPQGIVSNGDKRPALSVHHKTTRFSFHIEAEGALPRFDGKDEYGNPMESELARMVLFWAQYFDELLENAKNMDEQSVRLDWEKVLALLWAMREKDVGKPRRSLIVDIAEEMSRRISQPALSARRILVRERRLLPAGRIEETDSFCLRWLVRQPGESIPEKAGARQRLMGIARSETYDVHENRILKDFMLRCCNEGRRYYRRCTAENQSYKNTTRVQMVQKYSNLCAQLSRSSHLEEVTSPIPGTPANYVLLHDMRYRGVWHWYRKLLRRAEEEDRFWDWQARTWADIARILVNLALIYHIKKLSDKGKLSLRDICQASLRLHGEQVLGCRTASGSEAGPLHAVLKRGGELLGQGIIEVVHPDLARIHPIVSQLGATGGHLFLVVRPLERKRSTDVIIVWAVHTAASSKRLPWTSIGESAEAAISSYETMLHLSRVADPPKLRGIVVASDMRATNAECQVERKRLILLTTPMEPCLWMTAVEDISLALDKYLGEILA